MSHKIECPSCKAYTSSVATAYDRGEDCPYCGLSSTAMATVLEVRKRYDESELRDKYEAAEVRAGRAEAEAAKLAAAIRQIKYQIDRAIGALPSGEDTQGE